MRFILFVVENQTSEASGNEMAAIDEFNDQLRANAQWVMAAGIGSPATASLVDNRNDAGISQPGSLFSSQDFYSGFWVIETKDAATAQRLALEASKACNRRVELRPFLR